MFVNIGHFTDVAVVIMVVMFVVVIAAAGTVAAFVDFIIASVAGYDDGDVDDNDGPYAVAAGATVFLTLVCGRCSFFFLFFFDGGSGCVSDKPVEMGIKYHRIFFFFFFLLYLRSMIISLSMHKFIKTHAYIMKTYIAYIHA